MAEEPKNTEGESLQPLTLGGVSLSSAGLSAPRAALSLLERMCWLGRVFISSASRFYWDDGFSRAASLAYTSLLSLVPLTVVAFGLLASFATSTEYIGRAREFIFKISSPQEAQSGMSKRLRGRSLYLTLLCDAIATHIAEELETVFKQKLALKLYDQPIERINAMKTLTLSRDIKDFQFVLVLVDYNQNSTLLDIKRIKELPFADQIKVFHTGFGMWHHNVVSV